jgi:hypothetical protein
MFAGGLYEATKAAQGKDGSAMDVMSPARLKMSVLGKYILKLQHTYQDVHTTTEIPPPDLHRQMHRLGVPYNEPIGHPQRTVNAMRLLAAIADDSLRVLVSHALYKVEHSPSVHYSLFFCLMIIKIVLLKFYFHCCTISCAGLLV